MRRGPVDGVVNLRLWWAALALVLAMGGCSTTVSPGPPSNNEIARANFLIDQNQYSEAIFVLENRLKKDPTDLKARVLLASAYASRAGLHVANYSAFHHEVDKWNQIDEILPGDDEDDWMQSLAKITFRLQVTIRAFEALPNPTTPEALKDIDTAVAVLDDGGRLEGGPSIYRALLRVVQFKQLLFVKSRPKFLEGCRIAPEEMSEWLTNVTRALTLIIDDVAFGLSDPGARERTLQLARNLQGDLERILSEYLRPAVNLGVPPLPLPKGVDVPVVIRKVYGGCG